jgi:hypothetical protein
MAYPDMAKVLGSERQAVKVDWKRAFPTTDLLDQEAELGKLLYPEADALTKHERSMPRLHHRESRTNVHEPAAYAANIETKQSVEFLSPMHLSYRGTIH